MALTLTRRPAVSRIIKRTLDLCDIESWSDGFHSFNDAGFGGNAAIFQGKAKVKVALDCAGGKKGQHSGDLVGAILVAVNLASRSKGGFASFRFGDLAIDEKCDLSFGHEEVFLFSPVKMERRSAARFFVTNKCKDCPACLRSRGNDLVDTTTRTVANVIHKFCGVLIRVRFSSVAGGRPTNPL